MVGAGSQIEEEELQYLDLPRDMRTFEMPRVPERADAQALARSRAALAGFLAQLEDWRPGAGPNPRMDMRAIDSAALRSSGS
jgi:hydrogenase-1 operon protein HyaF